MYDKKYVHYRENTGVSQSDKISLHPESMYLSMELLKKELERRNKFYDFRYGFSSEVILYSMFYLDEMKKWNAFETLYNDLKDCYFQKLGVYDLPKEHCANSYWLKIRDFIKDSSAGEYAYCKWKGIDPFVPGIGNADMFPFDKIACGKKVVLYGAGAVGRSFFRLIKEQDYCICDHIVDTNYCKLTDLETPVENPEEITTWDFDFVLICVLSEKAKAEIKDTLLNLGIEEEKIIPI